jgi:hypothetical protein
MPHTQRDRSGLRPAAFAVQMDTSHRTTPHRTAQDSLPPPRNLAAAQRRESEWFDVTARYGLHQSAPWGLRLSGCFQERGTPAYLLKYSAWPAVTVTTSAASRRSKPTSPGAREEPKKAAGGLLSARGCSATCSDPARATGSQQAGLSTLVAAKRHPCRFSQSHRPHGDPDPLSCDGGSPTSITGC